LKTKNKEISTFNILCKIEPIKTNKNSINGFFSLTNGIKSEAKQQNNNKNIKTNLNLSKKEVTINGFQSKKSNKKSKNRPL